jgi:DNA-binding transcriptional regulator YiaG
MDAIDELLARPTLPPPGARAALRKAEGLSQETAARAVGVTRVAYQRWEVGTTEPDEEHRRLYLRLLNGLAAKHPGIWGDAR